jgi:hypothetical protein
MDNPPLTLDGLSETLKVVFKSLKGGRHICRDDMVEYRDIAHHEEQYRCLFRALGYELVYHGQGFFYFKGGNRLPTQRLQRIALFCLILFQHLEETKFKEADRGWIDKLVNRTFDINNELPHFSTSQRKSMLASLGVTDVESLRNKVLQPMAQMGMLDSQGNLFRFRSPIYRLVDLCMELADQKNDAWSRKAGPEEPQSALPERTDETDVRDDDENDDEEESIL